MGLVAALCGGCFAKPGFSGGDGGTSGGDGSGGDGGGGSDAPACTGAWGAPVRLTEFDNKVTGEPTMTRDRKHVYFAKQESGSHWEIHSATRSATDVPFLVTSAPQFDVGGSTYDQDPAVTDDNQLVVFIQSTSHFVAQVRWDGTGWLSEGALMASVTSLDISPDGLTLYYATSGKELFATKRASRMVPFTTSATPIASDILFPSVTGDGLTLYSVEGVPGTGIEVRTRTTTTDAFGPPTRLFDNAVDPDVTSDDSAMVVSVNHTTLGLATRACP